MGGFFMGTELNQALVQQALSFAPEITEERQAGRVWEVILMRRRLHSCRMETEGFTGR